MRGEDTWMMLLYGLGGAWFLWLWVQDARAAKAGEARAGALPGAWFASVGACVVAAIGAIGLVGLETAGEYALGISGEQQSIAALFLLAMLAAAVVEEIIFRGYCVVTQRGKAVLWASVLGFSVLFALLHPYLWSFEMPEDSWAFWDGLWGWDFGLKGWFSTVLVLLNSLWFYAVRFMPNNPARSLLPCMVAHAVSNLAVFVIKAAQGFVVWSV